MSTLTNSCFKKMRLFLIIVNISNFNITYCQDYSNYFRICNTADSLAFVGQETLALDTLIHAFRNVSYVHSEKYQKAYYLAIKLNRFEEAFYFGRNIIINSGISNKIQTKSDQFKSTKYYQMLNDSCDAYIDLFNNRVNHKYIYLIDSLHFIDQRIIRKNLSVRGKYRVKRKAIPKNRFELDSSNWQLLSRMIDSLGFPSEQNVGSKAYSNACIIIHHNLRLKANVGYHERIFEFIRTGEYLPEHFSFWYEQYQNNVNEIAFFYTWISNLSEEDLKRINLNREKFFLKGLWSYNIENDGKKMTSKW